MADLIGIFSASHAPPLVRDWEVIECGRREKLARAFAALGDRILALKPDVLVAIGADHWANFFIDNMPAICVGVGAEHDSPPEPWLAAYPHKRMAGAPSLALQVCERLFASGFEPSLSHGMKLDHAFCVPLWRAGLATLPAIVPIVVNAIQPPLPSVSRCYDLGVALAHAIRTSPGNERVVILATGGLSHSVGERDMGRIDEPFDREFLEQLERGGRASVETMLTGERMAAAGNGAAEVRFWVAARSGVQDDPL